MPSRPSNTVSLTTNGIRQPLLPSKSISPVEQLEKETVCPSGRSVQPSVLGHESFCLLCKAPVVPTNLRQRSVSPSERAISITLPSAKRYVPTQQLANSEPSAFASVTRPTRQAQT